MTDVTVYRCQCHSGVVYRKAADGRWWAVTAGNTVDLNTKSWYTHGELIADHGKLIAVEVSDLQSLIARLEAAETTIARIKNLAAWAANPTTSVAEIIDGYTYSHDQIAVADGGLLLVGEYAVYVRTDGDTPDRDGDWWMLNGSPDGEGPHQLSEVLVARHDEDTDRPVAWHNVEALITADMLAEAIAGKA
jgi:hypothetical protein